MKIASGRLYTALSVIHLHTVVCQ